MLERGIRLPRNDTLVKLAGGLEIPPGDLLDGLDWVPGGPRVGQLRIREGCSEDPGPKARLRRG